jgi:hypothetical protein
MTTTYNDEKDFDTAKGIIITYLHNGKEKKIPLSKVDRKYFLPENSDPNVHRVVTPAYMTFLINYVSNKLTEEHNAAFEAKKREEEQRIMQERDKQIREREELEAKQYREDLKKTPERQLQMILSGKRNKWYCCGLTEEIVIDGHSAACNTTRVKSLEPGLALLKEEYCKGKLLRLDDERYNRLVEFAKDKYKKDGETFTNFLNRLLDAIVVSPQ